MWRDPVSWRRLRVLVLNPPEGSVMVRAMQADEGKRSNVSRRQVASWRRRHGKR